MPDIDGFKLLEIIGLEMDIPVIMMSSNGDTETVLQGVTHGAVDFLIKPVRTEELRNIWQHVLRKQKEQGMQAGKNTDDKSEDNGAGEADHSSPETRKRAKDGRWELEDTTQQSLKRPRVHWSAEMHAQFVYAVNSLGIEKAVPKKILELMNVEGLTRENVASHLQKYRLYLKKTAQINDDNGNAFMKMSSAQPAPVVHVDTARPNSFPWETPAVNSTTTHPTQSTSTPGFLPSMPFMPGVPFMGQARPAMIVPQLQATPVASQQVPATVVPFIPNFIPMQPGMQQPHMAAPPGAAMDPHTWQQQAHMRPAQQVQFVGAPAMVPGGVVMDTGFPSMDANFSGMEPSAMPQIAGADAAGPSGAPSHAAAPSQSNGNRSVAQALLGPSPDPSGLMVDASGASPAASQPPKRDSMDIHFSQGFLDDLHDGTLLEGAELAMQPDPTMDDFLNFLAKDEPDL